MLERRSMTTTRTYIEEALLPEDGDAAPGYLTYPEAGNLSNQETDLLDRVIAAIPLVADLVHCDVLLYRLNPEQTLARVIAEARPHSVPPVHASPQLGRGLTSEQEPSVFRGFSRAAAVQGVTNVSSRGAPTVRSAWPVTLEDTVVAMAATHVNFVEHERQRRKSMVYRDAIAQLRDAAFRGQVRGANNLTPIGEHDAILVVDAEGQVLYISTIAENLYRRLGYPKGLLGIRLGDLQTDESVFFKCIDTGSCVQDVVQECDHTLIKRAVPLAATAHRSWLHDLVLTRLPSGRREIDGAILVVQDVTEARQTEQELNIKSTMIREIHHRVKNNLQTIAALLRLQARRTGSPAVGEMLQQTIHRILSIAVVHEYMSYDESSIVDLTTVTQRIVSEAAQGILDPDKAISISVQGQSVLLPAQQATSCALVINELLQNAVEHAFENRCSGTVLVTVDEDEQYYRFAISDDGAGLKEHFSLQTDGNLGMQIVQTLVKDDLRGTFELRPNDPGVTAEVRFPKLRPVVHLTNAVRVDTLADMSLGDINDDTE